MTHPDSPQSPASDGAPTVSRRRFLQGSLAAAAALASPTGSEAASVEAEVRDQPFPPARGKRPNFLIILCDQMRFPPAYETAAAQAFREQYLKAQELLLQNGVSFERHYAASAACVPSRASMVTGHYPSLHGASQTTGAAKEVFEPDAFWLDPASVPTFGDYFRAAGYKTFWKGKWHVSAADLLNPGTHTPLPSYDTETGERDPATEAVYLAADQLDPYGFSGWIGPEPHGAAPLDSGSSVPQPKRGRDVSFAEQTVSLIQELDHDRSSAPWVVVSSFVNPHDIGIWGLWVNLGMVPGFEFLIEDCVPDDLFLPAFDASHNDDLASKPSAQASYKVSYAQWMQPILDNPETLKKYYRYYYQLHKNLDEQMMKVLNALLESRFKDDTYVIFTSDHGEALGAHGNLHQKFYLAYDEAIRVPFIIWNQKLFNGRRTLDTPTSHVDLVPTLLGLAGIDADAMRAKLAPEHSQARPLVGRDLSRLILNQADPAGFNDPVYFMTDDEVSRGLNQKNFVGVAYASVAQPNHIETVIARLDDGKVWKFTRYWDNPQFWSSPGDRDVVLMQTGKTPEPEYEGPIDCTITVKATPKPDEYEMYNLTDDPMELTNLYNEAAPLPEQMLLAQLLEAQRAQKRLAPCKEDASGQPE